MSETKKPAPAAPKAQAAAESIAPARDPEKESLAAQLKASQEMNAKMMALLQEMQSKLLGAQIAPAAQAPSASTDVTLVYASASPGYLSVEGSGLSLHCTRYGETFVLSRSQLDALVGKYRKWFDNGTLALSDDDAATAAAKGVYTFSQLQLGAETLNRLGRMTPSEIESLWGSIRLESQKETLVLFYKQRFIEGAEGYRDRSRVDAMNRLTKNGFSREAVEASGLDLKIRPIDLA